MKLLRIKDNSGLKKKDFSDIRTLTGRIADKTLEQLEREGIFVFPETVKDTNDLTKNQMILQGINDTYRSGNVMGFIGCGYERLIIESRFSGNGDDHFFRYLLEKVLDFPNIVDLDSDANQDNRLFNFLLFLFPHYLKTAMRKGLFKKYIRHRYNDANVKGAIEIARHIKQNTPFTGNVAYSQREFSYDNSLMELVRHTIEFIKAKPYGSKLLIKVKDEVKLVINATPTYEAYDRQKIVEENQKNAVRHAYFREYLALQRLCILILRHQKHQIGFGSRQIYGILFDGAWLWEEYVCSLIGDKFYHPMNKGNTGAQRLFDKNIGLIYPDFISRDSEKRIISDAKYKPMDNIGNKDYLQILAYMFRFDAKTGYYLYPEADGADDLKLRLNCGSTYEKNVMPREEISVIKHGLKIPTDVIDYDEFAVKMKISEQEFKQVFKADDLKRRTPMRDLNKFKGCLIGGAVGDALGYAVEFMTASDIFRKYGENGITEYELCGGVAEISDDTQMTLFTATGLLLGTTRGMTRGIMGDYADYIAGSYKDWYLTQTKKYPLSEEYHYSWLVNIPEMFSRRAPGNTCLSALEQDVNGTLDNPINRSKGCGGVMRVAPIGLYFCDKRIGIEEIDIIGAKAAALTHGHELGYIPAAMLVHIILRISGYGDSILEAVNDAIRVIPTLFPDAEHMDELLTLIKNAIALSSENADDLDAIRQLGSGWVAEETLAIAVYCALKYSNNFEKGIVAAVNHDGDSDSTGAVTGNILGAALGFGAIPQKFLDKLELKDIILEVAEDLYHDCLISEYGPSDEIWESKYISMLYSGNV